MAAVTVGAEELGLVEGGLVVFHRIFPVFLGDNRVMIRNDDNDDDEKDDDARFVVRDEYLLLYHANVRLVLLSLALPLMELEAPTAVRCEMP